MLVTSAMDDMYSCQQCSSISKEKYNLDTHLLTHSHITPKIANIQGLNTN